MTHVLDYNHSGQSVFSITKAAGNLLVRCAATIPYLLLSCCTSILKLKTKQKFTICYLPHTSDKNEEI